MRPSKHHLPDIACFYSWNLAATKMPRKQNTSPILFFYTLFFTVKQNMRWVSQLATLIVLHLFFFCSHAWSRESPWDLVSLWSRSCNQVCGLAVWSNHLVCDPSIIRLKIMMSPMFLKSVKIWKSSSVASLRKFLNWVNAMSAFKN